MIRFIDPRDIPGRRTSYNELVTADIDAFLESGMLAAEIELTKYKSPESGYKAYFDNVKRRGLHSRVMVTNRANRAFLIRKENKDER